MKKIIKGILYDTKSGTKIHNYWNGLSENDFNWVDESLYLTKKGNYFLSGEGGPASRYAQSCGMVMRSSGSNIFPLNKQEALMWAETHEMKTEEIMKHFNVEEA